LHCIIIPLVVPANETSKNRSSIFTSVILLSRLLQNFMFEWVDYDILSLGTARGRLQCL
jgi:hypothetical protein